MKVKFSECVEYMIKGPFGSDMKKSLYVPKGEDTYKVYVQGNAIQKDESLGDYYVSSEYFHKKLKRFQVHPGDYLITCDGTLGKYIKLSENIEQGVISSSLLLLRLDESKIYDKFFELIWDNSMLKYLASQARNACLVHLPSAKAIGDVEIDLPEMSMQREIADKAFLIKDIVNKRNEEMGLLDELSKARFIELFGEPLALLDSGKTIPLEKIFSEITVGFVGEAASSYVKIGVPYLRTQNVRKGYIDFSGLIYVSEEFHNANRKSQIKPGDIVVSRVGVNRGMAAVIPQALEDANIANCLIIKKETAVNSNYLAYYLNMSYGLSPKFGASVGSAQGVINTAILKKWEMFLPPYAQQEQFAAFVEQIDKSKVVVQKALDEAQLLFDSLMQKYFG